MKRAGLMAAGTAAVVAMVAGVVTLLPYDAKAQAKKEAPLVTTGDAGQRTMTPVTEPYSRKPIRGVARSLALR